MKQDISASDKFCDNYKYELSIGTHSGIFHEDDVVACALFCIMNPSKSIAIIRSRDLDELSKCDLLVDIGGGKYDHHQIGENVKRENGIPYASSGLFWKYNGKDIIWLLSITNFSSVITDSEIETIFTSFDNKIIQEIDKIDNGISAIYIFLIFNQSDKLLFIFILLLARNITNVAYIKILKTLLL